MEPLCDFPECFCTVWPTGAQEGHPPVYSPSPWLSAATLQKVIDDTAEESGEIPLRVVDLVRGMWPAPDGRPAVQGTKNPSLAPAMVKFYESRPVAVQHDIIKCCMDEVPIDVAKSALDPPLLAVDLPAGDADGPVWLKIRRKCRFELFPGLKEILIKKMYMLSRTEHFDPAEIIDCIENGCDFGRAAIGIVKAPDHPLLRGGVDVAGLFVLQNIKARQVLGVYSGALVANSVLEPYVDRMPIDVQKRIWTYDFGAPRVIPATKYTFYGAAVRNTMGAANDYHGIEDEPSVAKVGLLLGGLLPLVLLIAKKDIPVGREVVIDYGQGWHAAFLKAHEWAKDVFTAQKKTDASDADLAKCFGFEGGRLTRSQLKGNAGGSGPDNAESGSGKRLKWVRQGKCARSGTPSHAIWNAYLGIRASKPGKKVKDAAPVEEQVQPTHAESDTNKPAAKQDAASDKRPRSSLETPEPNTLPGSKRQRVLPAVEDHVAESKGDFESIVLEAAEILKTLERDSVPACMRADALFGHIISQKVSQPVKSRELRGLIWASMSVDAQDVYTKKVAELFGGDAKKQNESDTAVVTTTPSEERAVVAVKSTKKAAANPDAHVANKPQLAAKSVDNADATLAKEPLIKHSVAPLAETKVEECDMISSSVRSDVEDAESDKKLLRARQAAVTPEVEKVAQQPPQQSRPRNVPPEQPATSAAQAKTADSPTNGKDAAQVALPEITTIDSIPLHERLEELLTSAEKQLREGAVILKPLTLFMRAAKDVQSSVTMDAIARAWKAIGETAQAKFEPATVQAAIEAKASVETRSTSSDNSRGKSVDRPVESRKSPERRERDGDNTEQYKRRYYSRSPSRDRHRRERDRYRRSPSPYRRHSRGRKHTDNRRSRSRNRDSSRSRSRSRSYDRRYTSSSRRSISPDTHYRRYRQSSRSSRSRSRYARRSASVSSRSSSTSTISDTTTSSPAQHAEVPRKYAATSRKSIVSPVETALAALSGAPLPPAQVSIKAGVSAEAVKAAPAPPSQPAVLVLASGTGNATKNTVKMTLKIGSRPPVLK